jgi:hypothetical protein
MEGTDTYGDMGHRKYGHVGCIALCLVAREVWLSPRQDQVS